MTLDRVKRWGLAVSSTIALSAGGLVVWTMGASQAASATEYCNNQTMTLNVCIGGSGTGTVNGVGYDTGTTQNIHVEVQGPNGYLENTTASQNYTSGSWPGGGSGSYTGTLWVANGSGGYRDLMSVTHNL